MHSVKEREERREEEGSRALVGADDLLLCALSCFCDALFVAEDVVE